MKRREFLQKGSLLTLTSGLLPHLSFSNALAAYDQTPQFFVQVFLSSGWHTSLSVDPWIKAVRPKETDAFIEYRSDELIQAGQIFLGPAMKSMTPFAQQLNIINGIFINANDNGHLAAEVYMQTGKGNGQYGSIAVESELSNQMSPLGVLFNSNVYKGNSSIDTYQISDLSNLKAQLSSHSNFDNTHSPIYKAMTKLAQNSDKIKNYNDQVSQLRASGTSIEDGHLIALSFKNNLANNSCYTISKNLDSHSNHEGTHLSEQVKAWEDVAKLLSTFKSIEWNNGKSMYDVTTFYITSEFSRTPALNPSKGTDHNPLNNSAVIIGPGFKGNSVFGASRVVTADESTSGTSYLIAQMVDLKTGEIINNKQSAKQNGHLIKPETIIATLASGLNIQRNIFPPISIDEKGIDLLLK